MLEFLSYDLKVAVLIAAFYFCYRLLMERDTLHRLNRVVLLLALALSLVLPLCVVTFHETQWIEPLPVADQAEPDVAELGPAVPVVPARQWWQLALTVVVVGGMVLRLAYLLRSYAMLRRMLRNGEEHRLDDGVKLVVVDHPVAPFSWMNTIVVNRQDYAERNALLLIHERSHIRLHHSRDVVFVELLTVLQWFNPVVWLLSRDLRTVHEYEADEAVLSQGADTAQYITLLMHKAMGVQACVLANGINTSETKKRVKMMIKMKSPRWSWLKCLYIVPIAALSLAVTAQTVTDYRTLPTNEKTGFALHAILDDYGRITGFTHEGEPDPRRPETFHVGYVFIDDREATPEEVANYKSLMSNAETFEMIHRPNETGDPKYSYRDKQGILIFHMKKQVPQLETDPVFEVCEVLPQFPGGDVEMMNFFMKNVKYPVVAETNGVQGCVLVSFIVEKDGSLSHVEAKSVTDATGNAVTVVAMRSDMTDKQKQEAMDRNKGIQALKDESERVVKLMPKWKPGKQRGETVRVRCTIPATFRLQ